jgi:predicted nucleic acid-binding Zn ribbon protein
MGEPRPIGELVGRILGSRRLRDAVHLGRLRLVWEEVVGPSLARRTRVEGLRGGTLVVAVSDPEALETLREVSGRIGERLRAKTGGEVKGVALPR